jgi:cytochrome c-type biogenesis protein
MGELIEAFTLGLFSAATPCLLPLYPAFVAYLASNLETLRDRRRTAAIGAVVLAGVLSTLVAVGLLVTAFALPLGEVLPVAVPIADVVVIALGLGLVLGRNPFGRLPGMTVPRGGGPVRQAYVYGLVLAPLALPCAGAFLVALLAIATGPLELGLRLATFLAYGLGFGLPLVVLSFASALRGLALARAIAFHHRAVDRIAGVVLVVIGARDLLPVVASIQLSAAT